MKTTHNRRTHIQIERKARRTWRAQNINSDMNYFSSMISKPKLGQIISIANNEATDIKKAEKFLELIRT